MIQHQSETPHLTSTKHQHTPNTCTNTFASQSLTAVCLTHGDDDGPLHHPADHRGDIDRSGLPDGPVRAVCACGWTGGWTYNPARAARGLAEHHTAMATSMNDIQRKTVNAKDSDGKQMAKKSDYGDCACHTEDAVTDAGQSDWQTLRDDRDRWYQAWVGLGVVNRELAATIKQLESERDYFQEFGYEGWRTAETLPTNQ